jgi:hypothetical protein
LKDLKFTRTRPARKIKNIFLPEPDLPEKSFYPTRPNPEIILPEPDPPEKLKIKNLPEKYRVFYG